MTTEVQADVQPVRAEMFNATDPEKPSPTVIDAVRRPGMRLAQMLETFVHGYLDRPALGRRSTSVVRDAATGRSEQQLMPAFETVSYGELWSDVKAIAAAWSTDMTPVEPGEFVATIGIGSTDYVRVDLVCAYLGLVSVPLQHNASVSQLLGIFAETQPRVLAVSAA